MSIAYQGAALRRSGAGAAVRARLNATTAVQALLVASVYFGACGLAVADGGQGGKGAPGGMDSATGPGDPGQDAKDTGTGGGGGGGGGGAGTMGGNGGDGLSGITFGNNAPGGAGGNTPGNASLDGKPGGTDPANSGGGGGGGGGAHGYSNAFLPFAPVLGGNGGNGADGEGSANNPNCTLCAGGGGGGAGGYGAVINAGTGGTLTVTVTAGNGGNGGQGATGSPHGGSGGIGIDFLTTNTVTIGANVKGGAGGYGIVGGTGGVGIAGTGLNVTVNQNVTISGGAGGNDHYPSDNGPGQGVGLGGAGISGSGLTIANGGTISGGQSGTDSASPTATRANAITFTGGTNALTLTSGGNTGTLTGNVAVGGALSVDPGTAAGVNVTLPNAITDYTASNANGGTTTTQGNLTKAGVGTVTLSSANTYTGTTTVNAGTLNLTGSLANTTMTVGNMATFAGAAGGTAGSGTTGGGVTIQQGGILSPGDASMGANAVGTLTVGSLALNSGAMLNMDLSQPGTVGGTANDLVEDKGNLTVGGTLNVRSTTPLAGGTYRLIDYTGTETGMFAMIMGAPTGSTVTYTNNQVNLLVPLPYSNPQYWNGATMTGDGTAMGHGGDGTWNATNTNWTNQAGTTAETWGSQTGIFAGAAGTVTLAAPLSFQALEFATSGYTVTGTNTLTATGPATITVDGATGTANIATPIAGTAGLTKAGAGTLTLSGPNTYSGTTTINAGTLALNHQTGGVIDAAGASDNSLVVSDGATLLTTVSGALIKNIQAGLNPTNVATIAAATGTTLQLGTTPTFQGSASFYADGNVHFGISGPTGAAGTIVFQSVGSTGYTNGATVSVDAGTVRDGDGKLGQILAYTAQTSVNNTATLDLNDHSDTIHNLQGTSSAAKITLGVNAATAMSLDTGSFAGAISGAGGVTKISDGSASNGIMTLSGTNAYGGATTINSGTLNLTGTLANTAMSVGNGGTFAGAAGATAGSGVTQGSVTVQQGGILSPGDATLGAHSVGTLGMASLALNAGAMLNMDLSAPGAGGTANDLVNVASGLTLGGTLAVNQLQALPAGTYELLTYGGQVGGNFSAVTGAPAGSFLSIGNNQVDLTVGAANAVQYWNGTTTTATGTVNGGNGSWTNAMTNTNWTNATGTVAQSWGSGTGIFAGPTGGTVTVDDAISFQALQFTTSGYTIAPGTGMLTATGAATVTTDANVAATISASIAGGNGLTKLGTGTLTLSAANTYDGGTMINAGTLALNHQTGGVIDAAGSSFIYLNNATLLGTVSGDIQQQMLVSFVNPSDVGTIAAANRTTLSFDQLFPGGDTHFGTSDAAGTVAVNHAIGIGGNVSIFVDAGTLRDTGGLGFVTQFAAQTSVNNAATLDLNDHSDTIHNLQGTSTAAKITLGVNAATTVSLDTGSFAGAISGAGGLTKISDGSASGGTMVLTGYNNTYFGPTTVNAGTLEVDGSISSPNMTVNSGGTLSGTGGIGNPLAGNVGATIAAGGTLAPGNAANRYGTLTMNGPLTFAPNSFYNVAITPTGANSFMNVVGTTTIQGGTVNVLPTMMGYVDNTKYKILTAAGAVTGKFASVATPVDYAFLMPVLSYDTHDVYLTVLPTAPTSAGTPDYRIAARTQNQFAVASGLTNAAKADGDTGPLFHALNQLTAAQARAAFDTLSGEGITAAQNVAFRSAQLFNSTIFDQTTFYNGGTANSITLTAPLPGMTALAPEQTLAAAAAGQPVRELADLPASRIAPTFVAPARTWSAWGTGFGATEDIRGNAAIGSASQSNDIYGGTLGVDYQLTPNYLVGVALGGSNGDFEVARRGTSGSTTGGHVALYDLFTLGAWYGASSTSFSYFDNHTSRIVTGFGTFGGATERGDFNSDEFRSRLEIGRHFDGFGGTLTPFVALEIADLRSNGFGERALSGSPIAALTVDGQSVADVPAFVGARLQRVTPLGNGMVLSPTLQVAYLHEFAPYRSQTAQIADLPGSTFLVDGARPSRNAAQVKAGGELSLGGHASLFANFEGEFSGVDQLYAGKGGFRYVW